MTSPQGHNAKGSLTEMRESEGACLKPATAYVDQPSVELVNQANQPARDTSNQPISQEADTRNQEHCCSEPDSRYWVHDCKVGYKSDQHECSSQLTDGYQRAGQRE